MAFNRGTPSRVSRRPTSKFSKHITDEEKSTLLEFLGSNAYSLVCVVVHLVEHDRKAKRQEIEQGVLCLVKDYAHRTYSLRLYDLKRRMQLRKLTVTDHFIVQRVPKKANVVEFETGACFYEINFSFIDEVQNFVSEIEKFREDHAQCRNSRSASMRGEQEIDKSVRQSNRKIRERKLTKADIGLPTNFEHRVHVGWDSNSTLVSRMAAGRDQDIDPSVEKLLAYIGWKADKLKADDKKFVKEFVETCGGIEQVRKELVEREQQEQNLGKDNVDATASIEASPLDGAGSSGINPCESAASIGGVSKPQRPRRRRDVQEDSEN